MWYHKCSQKTIVFLIIRRFSQIFNDLDNRMKGEDVMYSTVLSAAIHGLEVKCIHVEADVSNGLPLFHMVGYLSSEVKEAGERVRTAIRNSGFLLPSKKIVINLSPADVRKRGSAFDLPIAISILSSLGYIPHKKLQQTLFIGELGLDG